jgi:hypothetical protein
MKLSLPWRIGLVIALTGALAAGLAGYYSYRASRELLIAGAEDRLQTATRVLSRQLALALDAGARDVLVLALHPQAARLFAGAEAVGAAGALRAQHGAADGGASCARTPSTCSCA